MKKTALSYQLADGYVHDWLILGPCDTELTARPEPGEAEPAFRRRMLAAADRTQPDFDDPAELDRFTCEGGGESRYWEAAHCEADHLLDFSATFKTYTLRRVWAYVILSSAGGQEVQLQLFTTCPATVWLNGKALHFDAPQDPFADPTDQSLRTLVRSVQLKPRDNRLLVRLEQIAIGDAALGCGLRIAGEAFSVKAKLMTLTLRPKDRLAIERAYQFPYLDRAVVTGDDVARLISPEDTPAAYKSVLRLQTPEGWIYGEAHGSVSAGTEINTVYGVQLPPGPMQAILMPPPTLFYETNLRAQRTYRFWVANRPFSETPDADYSRGLRDLLRHASQSGTVFGELGQMAADWWGTVDPKNIRAGIGRVKRRELGCWPDLLGLLSMRQRMAGHAKFEADLLNEIDAALLGFDYREAAAGYPPLTEAEQIVLYTCQILAGQIFGRQRFTATGRTGRQERSEGEARAAAWLKTHARTGFGLWNAQTDLIIAALLHLVDLAKTEAIVDHAAVLLDKVLFDVAVHSFHGSFGGSRGLADVATLRSARFAAEAAIGRLLWGMGGPQGGMIAALSLMLAGNSYELPTVIHAIATDVEREVWARGRQSGVEPADAAAANTATYRTADFMLSSAQDYRPGARGRREHIWQATMSPEALVYTTHPTSFSESDGREAGWWLGNGRLPRVAQWKDALIALYRLPEDDWLGFTHAYFPTYAFNEYVLEGGWAFARVQEGYLALFAGQGFTLMRTGPDAYRELRSPGLRNVWLCQMGSREMDGSFEAFRRRVLARPPVVNGLHVSWHTIRDEHLEFDWTGPLLRNGQEEPIVGLKHHESIYGQAEFPADTMDITYEQDVMRLHLA